MKIKASLGCKVLLIVGSSISLAVLIILYISNAIILTSFTQLEEQKAYTNVERVQKSINGELESLKSVCGDWASWDDTKDFMLNQSSNYIKANFVPDIISDLNINFMVFLDSSGKLFYAMAFDTQNNTFEDAPQELIEHILADKSIASLKEPKNKKSGLIILNNATAFIAAQPISNSQRKGPVCGTLIIGRYLDDNLLKSFSEKTCLGIKVVNDFESPKDNIVLMSGKNSLAGYTKLYDLTHSKYTTLEINLPREIYSRGLNTVNYFTWAITITLASILAILLLVMQKFILTPIDKLTKSFSNILSNKNTSTKLYTERNDEIGSLARSFDKLMQNLNSRMLELDESQRLVRCIIDTDPSAVFVKDADCRYILVNKAMAEIYNTTCEEMLGKTDSDFLGTAISSADQAGRFNDDNENVLLNQKPIFIKEDVFVSPSGWTKYFQAYKIPIMIKDLKCVLGIAVDITERKKSEDATNLLNKELTQTTEKLELINAELKSFVYIASHDLREPLRKITAFGSMLKTSLANKLAGDDFENLTFMIDGAERMAKMVEGLLVYSRVSTQTQPLQSVNLNEIVQQLKQFELSIVLEEKHVVIDVEQNLPWVMADPVQIRQLMQNLIANGIKYQPNGAVPYITITSKPAADGMVRIEVTDNGIGIKPEYQSAIFAMFKRLHSRSEYEGTGIGLAVCKKIVERHSGKIGVESEFGKGSTFWFTAKETPAIVTADIAE